MLRELEEEDEQDAKLCDGGQQCDSDLQKQDDLFQPHS